MLIEFGSWFPLVRTIKNILNWYDKDDVVEILDTDGVKYELLRVETNKDTCNPIFRIAEKEEK